MLTNYNHGKVYSCVAVNNAPFYRVIRSITLLRLIHIEVIMNPERCDALMLISIIHIFSARLDQYKVMSDHVSHNFHYAHRDEMIYHISVTGE